MIRKLTFLAMLVCIGAGMAAQTTPPTANAVLQKAFDKAKIEKKNVFLIFHASWCGWCRKMDSAMNDPQCRPFFQENYVIEHLTILESKDKKHLENPGAADLFKRHAPASSGIPFWIIFNPEGAVLGSATMPYGSNSGCPASVSEVNHLINMLQKSSRLDEKTSRLVLERFRKNEPVKK